MNSELVLDPPSALSAASPPARDADSSASLWQTSTYCCPCAELHSNCLQAYLSRVLPYEKEDTIALPPTEVLAKEISWLLYDNKILTHVPFSERKIT